MRIKNYYLHEAIQRSIVKIGEEETMRAFFSAQAKCSSDVRFTEALNNEGVKTKELRSKRFDPFPCKISTVDLAGYFINNEDDVFENESLFKIEEISDGGIVKKVKSIFTDAEVNAIGFPTVKGTKRKQGCYDCDNLEEDIYISLTNDGIFMLGTNSLILFDDVVKKIRKASEAQRRREVQFTVKDLFNEEYLMEEEY